MVREVKELNKIADSLDLLFLDLMDGKFDELETPNRVASLAERVRKLAGGKKKWLTSVIFAFAWKLNSVTFASVALNV